MSGNADPTRGFFIIALNRVDCLTLSGVLLSFLSMSYMLAGKMEFALGVLYIAVIADAFDGILARKLGLVRDFGRYLDGFVDTLDYLVAPTLFLYLLGFNGVWQSLILIIFVCCGFIRLSVFNEVGNIEDENDGLSYLGAPVFWSTLVLGPIYCLSLLFGKPVLLGILMLLIPAFSLMMLHNGRYYKFKNPKIILLSLLAMSIGFFAYGTAEIEFFGSAMSGFFDHMITAVYATVPVIVGGVVHMIVVKLDALAFLKIPFNQTLFGANKTLRGAVVMPLGCMLGFWLLFSILPQDTGRLTVDFFQYSIIVSGVIMGLAYVLAELPNSFLKRRLGVAPGEVPEKNARLYILADQLDSGVLCILAFIVFWHMPWLTGLAILLMAPIIALSVKRILFMLKLKESST